MNVRYMQHASRALLLLLWLAGCSHTPAAPPFAVDLDQVIFLSAWTDSGTIRLTGGEYREPAAPGAASELLIQAAGDIAYGDIDGRPSAAVVMVTNAGGSGTFFDLALLQWQSGIWVNTDTAELGDRVQVHSLAIADNAVRVDLTTHGPGDPMCCPSLRLEQIFSVQDRQLAESGAVQQPAASPALVGVVWKWQRSRYNNDTQAVPPDPNRYTVQLLPEGSISIRADCNRAGGIYRLANQQITIEITHSTMAACPPDSLEQIFIRDLGAAALHFIRDGTLYLELQYDTGTMQLLP